MQKSYKIVLKSLLHIPVLRNRLFIAKPGLSESVSFLMCFINFFIMTDVVSLAFTSILACSLYTITPLCVLSHVITQYN